MNQNNVVETSDKTAQEDWYKCTNENSTTIDTFTVSYTWRRATDIEKDTATWGHDFNEGDVRNGRINGNLIYVYENGNWRLGSAVDGLVAMGCIASRENTVKLGSDGSWYTCKGSTWRVSTDIEKDTVNWGHDFHEGDIRNGQVNSDWTYVYQNANWRLGTVLDSLLVLEGGTACVNLGDTSAVKYDGLYYVCTANANGVIQEWKKAPDIYNDTYEERGECRTGGSYGNGTLLVGRVNIGKRYVCDESEFRAANATEISGGKGCTSHNRNEYYVLNNQYSYYKCTSSGWTFTIERLNTGSITYGGKSYKTIGVKSQKWMAENLNVDYKVGGTTYGTYTGSDGGSTYGRYYTWAAAMDSAGVYSTNSKGCGSNKYCTVTTPARGICPEGWHIPTSAEWSTLYSVMGNSPYAMQATEYTNWPDATDAYGFSARPAGYYYSGVKQLGSQAQFWHAAEMTNGSSFAYYWDLQNNSAQRFNVSKIYGLSVRCVQD